MRHAAACALEPPAAVLGAWARRLAVTLAVRQPRAALARLGIGLLARTEPLRGRGRQVFGAWDPVLRRIEIYGGGAARSDAELVRTLGHELWHAMADARRRAARRTHGEYHAGEAAAQRFADMWLQCLAPADVQACAAALRALAPARSEAVSIDGGA